MRLTCNSIIGIESRIAEADKLGTTIATKLERGHINCILYSLCVCVCCGGGLATCSHRLPWSFHIEYRINGSRLHRETSDVGMGREWASELVYGCGLCGCVHWPLCWEPCSTCNSVRDDEYNYEKTITYKISDRVTNCNFYKNCEIPPRLKNKHCYWKPEITIFVYCFSINYLFSTENILSTYADIAGVDNRNHNNLKIFSIESTHACI